MVASNQLSSCPTGWKSWIGWWTLILWLVCCKALLWSGLIYLPQGIGNNSATGCCVQTQSCYARLNFPENCKLQWTVYLLCLLLFMCLLIYLFIHPPKSNSQLETSQMQCKCFHVPSSILPRVIFLAVHKTLCQYLLRKKLNCAELVVICWWNSIYWLQRLQKITRTYFCDRNWNRNCGFFLLHWNKNHCIFKMCFHLYVLL